MVLVNRVRAVLAGVALTASAGLVHAQQSETDARLAAEGAAIMDPHDSISEASRALGGKVYRENCAACHDTGANRAPQVGTLFLLSPRMVVRALTGGAMKAQGAALNSAEKAAVAEFVTHHAIAEEAAAPAPPHCTGRAARFDPTDLPLLDGWGLDAANSHAIPGALAGLDRGNIGRLHLKWALAFPGALNAASQPTLGGGAIYVGGYDGKVYALDRETGCARWTFSANGPVRTGMVLERWRTGAHAAPRLYFGDMRGNAYALDALTGKLVWRRGVDVDPNAIVTGTPTLRGGTLYVPVSSFEEVSAGAPGYECCKFRGSLLALDARTGRAKWRAWMTPTPRPQGRNAAGIALFGPSGAALWSSPLVDARRGRVYLTSGDNYSSPASPLSDAIVALDAASGKVVWSFQGLGADAFNLGCGYGEKANCPKEAGPDYDFGSGAMLGHVPGGRDVLLAGQKSGEVFALDPDSGKLIWRQKVGRGGALGGVHFGMANAAGRVFVPITDYADGVARAEPAHPGVYALDLADGHFVWRAPADNVCGARKFCQPGYSAAITVAGPLLLAGSTDGHVRAFGASDGKLLWDTDTDTSFATVSGAQGHGGSMSGGAAPIAWKGKLIVNSGYGGLGKMPGNVLLVYDIR